jgi:Ca-activated chloride channel family protein
MRKIIIFICFISFISISDASFRSRVKEGNKKYYKSKYEEALEEYRTAQLDKPDSYELHMNIGNSLYKLEKYQEALEEYEKATYSKNIKIQAQAYYNQGNTLYRMNKLLEAIEMYKKCLEINPNDEDAKYNIEYIQRKLKESAQQKQITGKQSIKQEEKKSEKDKQKEQEKKEQIQRILNMNKEQERKAQKQKRQTIQTPSFEVEEDW